jgi:uncharacterized membrane protein YcaP (DUF421 family)
MGDLVQQSVTQQDYSVTSGVLAVSTFVLLTVGLSYAKWRWPRTRPVIHGVPVVVVSDGEPVIDAMRAERLSIDDLMAAAREQGIERFSDMRLAVLEADGGISFFRHSDGSSGAPEKTPAGD